jgi:hypothetical protein
MDVVYLCKHGSANEQLRYSLRSLVNLDHERVWIVGGWPRWVSDVRTIAVARRRSRYEHTTRSLCAAASHPEISETFVLMNDDFYIMHPTTVQPHHRGEIGQVQDPRSSNHYRHNLRQTMDWLRTQGQTSLDYDLHIPMVLTKTQIREMAAMALPDSAQVFTRSVYGNLFGIGGTELHDPKVRDEQEGWHENWTYLSTTAITFYQGAIGSHIRAVFCEEGPYEV